MSSGLSLFCTTLVLVVRVPEIDVTRWERKSIHLLPALVATLPLVVAAFALSLSVLI